MAAKKVGLGRGLGALIREVPAQKKVEPQAPSGEGTLRVPVERIHAAAWQPRQTFRPGAMEELVQSIRERGVLQPLLVRAQGEGYELIAGERRLRASIAAGLGEVPVRVLAVDDRAALELALIENLQREDLDPIEEAEGYRALADRFDLTQEQIAERVGRARASVTNALRLLSLPEPVRKMLQDGRLSIGHAKVLLGLAIPAEQILLAEQSMREGLSVRDLEKRVAKASRPPRKRRASRPDVPETHLRDLTDRVQQHLGTAVRIAPSRTLANGRRVKGMIEIDYYTNDDLDRLMILLGVSDDF